MLYKTRSGCVWSWVVLRGVKAKAIGKRKNRRARRERERKGGRRHEDDKTPGREPGKHKDPKKPWLISFFFTRTNPARDKFRCDSPGPKLRIDRVNTRPRALKTIIRTSRVHNKGRRKRTRKDTLLLPLMQALLWHAVPQAEWRAVQRAT